MNHRQFHIDNIIIITLITKIIILTMIIIILMIIRCSLLYLHSDYFSCPMIGNSSRATSMPERTLPFSSTTQGAFLVIFIESIIFFYNLRCFVHRNFFICNRNAIHQTQSFSRYVTPLLTNLKRGNGGEISEGEVHLATGTLDTNTFEVEFHN